MDSKDYTVTADLPNFLRCSAVIMLLNLELSSVVTVYHQSTVELGLDAVRLSVVLKATGDLGPRNCSMLFFLQVHKAYNSDSHFRTGTFVFNSDYLLGS